MLVELTRPVGHDLVDLGAPLQPCRGRAVARIADQILATHRLEQAVPMLRTGSARVDIDVVVRSAALARVDADRRLATPPDGSRADARRRLTVGAIHVGEGIAYVVHDRVLHPDHKMLALASAQASDVGGEDRYRHHHAGAGVADCGARLAGFSVLFAGDRHQSAARLRDHIEGEVLFEWAAGAETLDLAVDDRRIDGLDRLVTEAEALYGTGSEVLDHHVGAFDEALDELEPARVLKVDCGRTLIRIVL